MPTKSLRILIADTDAHRALKVERVLNDFGYYRVAPLYSREALAGLRDAQDHDFDLLLIHQEMAGGPIVDVAEYRKDNPQFKHVLMYADTRTLALQIGDLMRAVDPSLHAGS